jgi:hypothetical protein
MNRQSWPRSTFTPVNSTSTGSVNRQPLTSSWRMKVGGSSGYSPLNLDPFKRRYPPARNCSPIPASILQGF